MNQSNVRRRRKSNKKKHIKTFWQTFAKCFFIELLVVLVVGGFLLMNHNLGGGQNLASLSVATDGEVRNVAIFGTDKSGLRSDVIMILSVYPDKDTVTLMSVPRDTKVLIDRSAKKINAALQIGGDDLAVRTVKDLLAIDIHDYAVVNFEAVETIIDRLGGIRFDVPCDMYYQDPDQDLYINIKKGEQLLDGEDSVKVLRFRQYPMGDLQRNQVQQDFFKAAFEQKFQAYYIGKVPEIYGVINQGVRSSMNLNEILSYLNAISAMDGCTVQTFELPVSIADPYVVINRNEAEAILDEFFR